MIGIRADGNNQIGLGHVMRCLSIADKLKACGEQVIFFMADENAAETVRNRGFEMVCLNSDWNDPDAELVKLLAALRERGITGLLLDGYYFSEDYMRSLKNAVYTAYLDDLCAFHYPVDCIINYSVYAKDMPYPSIEGQTLLLGTDYAPLREQFQKDMLPEKSEKKNILVLSGGTDPYNIAECIPKAILEQKELEEYRITVVIGKYAIPCAGLVQNDRVIFMQNVTDMAALMRGATFAVSAGGSTLYELCACKVPTVTYAFVDNQLGNVEKFDALGVMPYAGDLRKDAGKVTEKLIRTLVDFSKQDSKQKEEKMERLVDGNGAMRVAMALLGK